MKCPKCGGTMECGSCGEKLTDIHKLSERVIPGSSFICSYSDDHWVVGLYWGWWHRRLFTAIWIENAVDDMRAWLYASEKAGRILGEGEGE